MRVAKSFLPTLTTLLVLAVSSASAKTIQPPDAWLTAKAKIAVLTAVGTAGTLIHVDTVDGRMTLHGRVAEEKDKRAAEKAVQGIEGVRAVRNLLQVVPPKSRAAVASADAEVQDRVERALRDDSSLKGSRIVIQSVNDGTVLLAGKTDSLSNHLRAVEDARQARGVRRVESEIESPDAKGDETLWQPYGEANSESRPSSTSTAQRVKDAAVGAKETAKRTATGVKDSVTDLYITSATKARLLPDHYTRGTDINVDTDHGVVTLFGSVPSAEAKRKAAAEARKVGGVRRVVNELQIVPADVQTVAAKRDAEIEDEVEKAVGTERSLKDVSIHVEVRDGVARLSGTVPNEDERLAAVTKASRVDGVRKVEDDLRVKRD